MEIWVFTTRLFIAFGLGAAVGVERQWRQKSAGLRTNTLVSVGAAIFIMLSIEIGGQATGRIASYIVSGIGFLGAGVIMKDGVNVQGLNTAATIWCSAALGSLCGMGLYVQACIAAFTVMLIHVSLRPLGLRLSRISYLNKSNTLTEYLLTVKCMISIENHIRVLLIQMLGNNEQVLLQSLGSESTTTIDQVKIEAIIKATSSQDSLMEQIASRLTVEEKVVKVSWEILGSQSDL